MDAKCYLDLMISDISRNLIYLFIALKLEGAAMPCLVEKNESGEREWG
jgi:hypothetical protein